MEKERITKTEQNISEEKLLEDISKDETFINTLTIKL